jgi:hypothetical protein
MKRKEQRFKRTLRRSREEIKKIGEDNEEGRKG